MSPRASQEQPRHAQERPKSAQDTPKSAQEASKTAPRAPKRPPRPPQEASRIAPGGHQDAKMLQEASGEPFGTHFASILGTIRTQKPSPHRPADNCSRGNFARRPQIPEHCQKNGQKQSPSPLNDDSSCRQNRRAKPQNGGVAVDRRRASYNRPG